MFSRLLFDIVKNKSATTKMFFAVADFIVRLMKDLFGNVNPFYSA